MTRQSPPEASSRRPSGEASSRRPSGEASSRRLSGEATSRRLSGEASSRRLSGEATARRLSGEATSGHLWGEKLAAAYWADPLRPPPPDLPWSACDAQAVVEILQRNKVPLLSLVESEENRSLFNDPLFQSARRAEEQDLTGLRAEYRKVKEALASEGITDVMIKSVGLAPSFPYRSDNLDVLFKPRDAERVGAVLCDMGYVELKNVEEPLKYLFRKFHAGRSVSAIHLHMHVGWMVSFLDEETLWQRCSVSDDDPLITIPAAEDALLTTLAHYFYEDKRVALLDVLKFAHCLRRGVDWDEVYRVADWRGWRDGLNASLLLCAYQEHTLYGETLAPSAVLQRALDELPRWTRRFLERHWGVRLLSLPRRTERSEVSRSEASRAGPQEMPLRIPFVFSKVFFYTKLLRDPTRSTGRKLKDLAVHTANGTKLRLHIHSQPAMLVTFSGVDGCGKTTQAKALQSAFHTCHLRATHVWSRGGSARWVGFFTRWSRQRMEAGKGMREATGPQGMSVDSWVEEPPEPQQAEKVRARQQRFRSPWLRWGWSWLTAIELVLQYARHVALPLLLGRVVICDRYVYDALADWAAYFGEKMADQRLAAKIVRLLTPRPRIGYWLDVPPAVAQSRSKDGVPEGFVAAQSAAYSRMADLYGLRRLDGSRGKEEIADQVVYRVLSTYFAHYHTLINTLFLKNPGQWR
jgi:thymidylate kinase